MSDCETHLAEDRLNEANKQWRKQEVKSTLPESAVLSTLEALRKADEGSAFRRTRRGVIWDGVRYGGIAATVAGLLAVGLDKIRMHNRICRMVAT